MILTLLLIILTTLGGTALTYLYEREDSLLARLAAGCVAGAAVFGTAAFALACAAGFSAATVGAALVVGMLPLALFARGDYRRRFAADLGAARGRLEGADFGRLLRFGYYVFVLVLLWLFFERAVFETKDGIFTGGSQNLGDLPFHLGAIFSFTEGNNFPPENPSFANAKFTYPFLADLVTACFVELGANLRAALLVPNVAFGFALVVLLEKFTVRLTASRLAGKIAPLLLLFSGGLGFVWFLRDYWHGAQGFFEILWKLPQDYTIGEKFRWGNSLVTLFLTQRSLLFGMPLTLVALVTIWDLFASEKAEEEAAAEAEDAPEMAGKAAKTEKAETRAPEMRAPAPTPFAAFVVGLLAGLLPLVHVHSLAALFVVCALLFFFRLDRWKEWFAFAAGVALLAVPELLWSLTGSASDLAKFIEPHFGWDAGKQNFVVFWAKNIGLFAPALALGLYLALRRGAARDDRDPNSELRAPNSEDVLIFYLPFAFLFLISNTAKLAPWEWDNIKVLIYWFVGSLPFAALALAWLWRRGPLAKAAAALAFAGLTLAGALDVWRTVSGQIEYQVFSADAVKIAALIRERTAPNALFLNAPTYNSAVVLAGRRSLMRYSGHLSSYGIDYQPREDEVRRIYEGTALADRLLEKNKIEYVIISPEETGTVTVREEGFYKYPIVAGVGAYKVFKVR